MELNIVYGKVFKRTEIIGNVKYGDYGIEDVKSVACTIIIDDNKLKKV